MTGDYSIAYSYIIHAAGWHPLYQIEADINKKVVKSKFSVELWQRTAMSWNGTSIILTTATPTTSPVPSCLPPWNVGVNRPQPAPKVMMARSGIQTLEATQTDSLPEVFFSQAMQWSLGKQNVIAGEAKILTLSTTVFDADFLYTLRPYVANEAFFTANITSSKQVMLPRGRASFSIGGVGVGQGMFEYTPQNKNVVYFGKDPLVTGTMELEKDELTITKKEQIRTYLWKIRVQNRRRNNVHVIVQDVKAQTTSAQIAISLEGSSPQPNVTAKYVEWDIPSLRSQKVDTLSYKVTMIAPLEIEIVSPR